MATRLLFVFISLSTIRSVFGDHVAVLLGDPVRFAATGSCRVEGAELNHPCSAGFTQVVARYQDGLWRPGPGYEDRMQPNVSLTLTSTNINDNGLYELSCGDKRIQVDVVPFYALEVAEGHTATLPCYYVTTGTHVQAVWWEKDGQRVFQQNFTGENTSPGGFEQGDFSLTLQRVGSQHWGDYFCYVCADGRKERGNPAAVRLSVHKASPGQIPTTAPRPLCKSTEGDATGTRDPVVAALGMFLVCAPLFTLLGWCLKSRWPNDSSGSCRDRFATARNKLFSRSCPPHSQSNDGVGAGGSYEVVMTESPPAATVNTDTG